MSLQLSNMVNDVTLQALAEANQYLQREATSELISGTVLSKRLYTLLIKNVSKDDPLTQDELQVRDFYSLFLFFSKIHYFLGIARISSRAKSRSMERMVKICSKGEKEIKP